MKNLLTFGIFTALLSSCLYSASGEYYIASANAAVKKYNPSKKDRVIVVDYTKSILSTRLYIIDLASQKIIFSSRVAHAYKSGALYPTEFSNKGGSNMSCDGVFKTGEVYYGAFGKSMRINGLDAGRNSNASSRAIIFHSSKKMKTLWSKGCFATPEEDNQKIIDLTKDGRLVVVLH